MKRPSYWQLEGLMLKVYEDSQNGLETVLGRLVRESLDSQLKRTQEALAVPDAKHVAKRD